MTDRYAVFGNPVSHSKSPFIHMAFARQTGQDIAYEAIDAPLDGFNQALRRFIDTGASGANITVPFKLEAFAAADEQRPRAELAGAANCLKFEGGRIIAENFDGIGLVNDIERNLGFAIAGKSVLMVGAGGAARGAIAPILKAGPTGLTIVNRTVAKAGELQALFAAYGPVEAMGYDGLTGGYDLVINATSASLTDERPALSTEAFKPGALAYEMVYGKGLTPFLALARKADAGRLADGAGMLVEQAAEAFRWWRGVRPETGPLIEAIDVPLT